MRHVPALMLSPLLLLAAAVPAVAASVHNGRVVAVTDGHSVVALIDNRRTAVRIAGIEAPTGTQRHAIGSRQSLVAVCGGEPAHMEVRAKGEDGTLVARVLCNGVDAGAEQVRRGLATVAARVVAPEDAALVASQSEARAAKRGLWATAAAPGREPR